MERSIVQLLISFLFAASVCHAGQMIDGIAYPDPLEGVTSVKDWELRKREEILNLFLDYHYGRELPKPTKQSFTTETTKFPNTIRKLVTIKVTGPYGSLSFVLRIFLPPDATRPVPIIMYNSRSKSDDPDQNRGDWPVQDILSHGIGAAHYDRQVLAPDNAREFRQGAINIFYDPKKPLGPHDTKCLMAWAWGASRCMDYFVSDDDIDHTRIGIVGHSRGGKTALIVGATDQRFQLVWDNDSNQGGATLYRRYDICKERSLKYLIRRRHYWWSNYYNENYSDPFKLPFDQHELCALIAPRYLYGSSGRLDRAGDPKGEYLAHVGAAPVYKLYGIEGLPVGDSDFPPAFNVGHYGEGIGYHINNEKHSLHAGDWKHALKFMDMVYARPGNSWGCKDPAYEEYDPDVKVHMNEYCLTRKKRPR